MTTNTAHLSVDSASLGWHTAIWNWQFSNTLQNDRIYRDGCHTVIKHAQLCKNTETIKHVHNVHLYTTWVEIKQTRHH